MSTDTRVFLYCDGFECIELPESEAGWNAGRSRQLARSVGWHYSKASGRAKDLCPTCWKAGER